MIVASPHRSRGVGQEALRLVESDISRHNDVTQIDSAVQTNNPNAIRFWKRNGYAVISDPEQQPDGTTTYHLRKSLPR